MKKELVGIALLVFFTLPLLNIALFSTSIYIGLNTGVNRFRIIYRPSGDEIAFVLYPSFCSLVDEKVYDNELYLLYKLSGWVFAPFIAPFAFPLILLILYYLIQEQKKYWRTIAVAVSITTILVSMPAIDYGAELQNKYIKDYYDCIGNYSKGIMPVWEAEEKYGKLCPRWLELSGITALIIMFTAMISIFFVIVCYYTDWVDRRRLEKMKRIEYETRSDYFGE